MTNPYSHPQAIDAHPKLTSSGSSLDTRSWECSASTRWAQLSPLYETFIQVLDGDDELEALLALVDSRQPVLETFFMAVNFLLYEDTDDPLASFYPSLSARQRSGEDASSCFRGFCLRHQEALQQLLSTLRLQTNEPTRCANLLPTFELVSRLGKRRPLALIEIGCSAGLTLRWDQYRYYCYLQADPQQDGIPRVAATLGNPFSPALIRCTLEGKRLPPLPHGVSLPAVAQRVGIDLSPFDVTCEADQRLLKACLWPEAVMEQRLLRDAITVARRGDPFPLLSGDACDLLPALLEALPPGVTPCLYHSDALTHGPTHVHEQVRAHVQHASRMRDCYLVSLERAGTGWDLSRLELFVYRGGTLTRYDHLAECAVHGERMRWVATY